MTKSQKISALLCGAIAEKDNRYFQIEKMVQEYISNVTDHCAICGEPECYHRKPNAPAVPTCDKFTPGKPLAFIIMERHEIITGVELPADVWKFYCEMIAHILEG